MVINALFTNSVTNALHAFFLFVYFIGALIHFIKKDSTFSLLIVLFFFTTFILKLLGIYVHYYAIDNISPPWIAIALLTILLNYFVVQSMQMPNLARIVIVVLTTACAYLFIINNADFIYIALPLIITYLTCAYYAPGMARWGFVMIVLSNILWIAARTIENHIAGHEITMSDRYDNDVYHILLIISTFVIYKAIAKGHWKYPQY